MKPCAKNRKLIAWLVAGVLEPEQEQLLRAHVASCEGCAEYLTELSRVASAVASAEGPNPPVMATPNRFHQRVLGGLRAESRASIRGRLRFIPSMVFDWRIVAPVGGAIGLALALLAFRSIHHPAQPKAPTVVQDPTGTHPPSDLSPTFYNYQVAANDSPETLDELLNRQARRNLPAPLYTASSFARGANSDF